MEERLGNSGLGFKPRNDTAYWKITWSQSGRHSICSKNSN